MNDDYLWDPNARKDEEVAEIERLLGRFAHDDRPLADRPTPVLRGPRPFWITMAAGMLIAAALVYAFASNTEKSQGLVLTAGKTPLTANQWVTATKRPRLLELGRPSDASIGRFELAPGSRLQVRAVSDARTLLHLERGKLHAFVTPDAAPRFFQVSTPAAVCVDLGCEYDLVVEANGDARVNVTLGQVAFETDAGDVFVPRGAECRAFRDSGLGLPYFSDGGLAGYVEKYHFAPTPRDRRGVAVAMCELIEHKRDTLTLWHLLRTDDLELYARIEQALILLVGHPEVTSRDPAALKGAPSVDPETWRTHLETYWW